ncbi:MAG: acyltransferase [Trebonia sp.]|jgi:acetyltransferase-like isoleucine patch superfamily enzyme
MSIKTSLPGARPIPAWAAEHPVRLGFVSLPNDARQTLRWLLRGHAATSSLLPTPVRRALLRLGGVQLGAAIWGLERCYFESEHVSLGPGCSINAECWFEGHGRIVIGHNCMFGSQVMILTSNHDIGPDGEVTREATYADVHIGDRCWIGTRAMIMPGVTIGEGTVIGAGALVTKDCEPGAVYVGVPARRVR